MVARVLLVVVVVAAVVPAQTLTFSGTPALSYPISLTTTGTPGAVLFLAWSFNPGPTTIPGIGTIQLGTPWAYLTSPITSTQFWPILNANGVHVFNGVIPLRPFLVGTTVYVQAAYHDFATPLAFTFTNGVNFTISDPAFAPTITSVTPSSGGASGGTSITISGTNFDPTNTTVTLGGQPLANMVIPDAMTITGDTPPGVSNTSADLVVSTSSGVATLAGAFTYTPEPPNITDISPDHSQVGGGALITITGSGLGPGTTVFIAGQAVTAVTQSDTQVVAFAPTFNQLGFVDVVASSSIGFQTLSAAFRYTIPLDTGNGSDGPFAPTTHTVLDTTVNGGVFNFTYVDIPVGVTVTATGPFPLVLRCQGDVNVSGTLDLSGSDGAYPTGGAGGPGGFAGGDFLQPGLGPGTGPVTTGNAGTNASFGTAGQACGGWAGGPTYGTPGLVPLQGGSGGTGSFGGPCPGQSAGSGGGGGGGALSVSAAGDVSITGAIPACGGGGAVCPSSGDNYGGGAGSGGAVRIATQGTVFLSGVVNLSGGTHGSSSCQTGGGGNGRWFIENWLGQTAHGTTATVPVGVY